MRHTPYNCDTPLCVSAGQRENMNVSYLLRRASWEARCRWCELFMFSRGGGLVGIILKDPFQSSLLNCNGRIEISFECAKSLLKPPPSRSSRRRCCCAWRAPRRWRATRPRPQRQVRTPIAHHAPFRQGAHLAMAMLPTFACEMRDEGAIPRTRQLLHA
jgi:hypothetical protein